MIFVQKVQKEWLIVNLLTQNPFKPEITVNTKSIHSLYRRLLPSNANATPGALWPPECLSAISTNFCIS